MFNIFILILYCIESFGEFIVRKTPESVISNYKYSFLAILAKPLQQDVFIEIRNIFGGGGGGGKVKGAEVN